VNRQNFAGLFDVSRLTLGGGGIGQVWGETSQEEAIATVHSAYEQGINFFDLAPLYGRGEAETVMGLAFPNGYPDEVHITTKCMLGATKGPLVEQALFDSLDMSLARMKRDSVDVFILHGYVIPDNWTSPLRGDLIDRIAVEWTTYCNHVIPAFENLKSSGRISAWGITAASTQVTNLDAIESVQHPDVVQCITNLIDSPGSMAITNEPPDPRGVIAAAKHNNVGVMGIRAVAAGSLTGRIDRSVKENSAEALDFDRAGRFRQLAADLHTTPAKLAHQYALTMDGVDTVVLGVKNRAELLECIEAEAQANLSAEVVALIDQAVA
jgi:aryl-alcohol dehydrogenase-like predicted oxidoreductase